jgi:CheY-like chemotaxis protein
MGDKKFRLARILLVEDNEGDIILTLDAFEESKIDTKVSVARNGREALDFLYKRKPFADAQRPDLILLDINIPIFSGHEVLEEIKKDESLKKIPVVMLTTSQNQKDVERAYKNHCNSYVNKPLEMKAFIEAIHKIEEFWLQLTVLSE